MVSTINPVLVGKWKAFFDNEKVINAKMVDFRKECACGSGKDQTTGLPKFPHVFYFQDEKVSGWACILCKRPSYPDSI